jgi:hypothetical protein
MAAASIVFFGVLVFVTRKRANRPTSGILFMLTGVVVVGGMLFARYGHILLQPPWWIYYGVPASATILLPPATLRMRRAEILLYLPVAALMAPAIHVFFSLVAGWHDYMPFPVYIPSFVELFHRLFR